jgi:hypothetical protein
MATITDLTHSDDEQPPAPQRSDNKRTSIDLTKDSGDEAPPAQRARTGDAPATPIASRPDLCPLALQQNGPPPAVIVVAPRHVRKEAILFCETDRDRNHVGITIAGVVFENANCHLISENAATVRQEESNVRAAAHGWINEPGIEAQAMLKFLAEVAGKPDLEAFLGAHARTSSGAGIKVEFGAGIKATLSWICHDMAFDDEFHRVSRLDHNGSLVGETRYNGFHRETLRAALLDDGFAPDGSSFEQALAEKMKTWSFYVSTENGAASSVYNVSNRSCPGECPPECPTAQFFPGCQFNHDPEGSGEILVCIEHDVSGGAADLLSCPVKSFVVLAERSGNSSYPWKPGDGGFYEDGDGDY